MRRALVLLAALSAVAGAVTARATSPDREGAAVRTLTIHSHAAHRTLKVSVVVPSGGAAGRPLLVFLHGRGGDNDANLSGAMFRGLAKLGDRAPVVAFPDGGDHSYWHDRGSGRWGRYVMREVIPAVQRRFGTDRGRLAIGGISMGGFGAYDLARLHPRRFCAVGGHSPALWRTAGETAPGAFDDAADFARHDVVAHARALRRVPAVWLDAGDADPFRPGDAAFAAALRRAGVKPSVHTWPGGHDGGYWNRHFAQYLRFYARALARCTSS